MSYGKNNDKKTNDYGISKGYRLSSVDPNKMITDSGKFLKSSGTGSWNLNGYKYTDLHNLEKSKKW